MYFVMDTVYLYFIYWFHIFCIYISYMDHSVGNFFSVEAFKGLILFLLDSYDILLADKQLRE